MTLRPRRAIGGVYRMPGFHSGFCAAEKTEDFYEHYRSQSIEPNLVEFGITLRQAGAFGQPPARFSQVFGLGGPRAFQLGARVTFQLAPALRPRLNTVAVCQTPVR
jgi:hypothetical protein